jgi:hypothetical protein
MKPDCASQELHLKRFVMAIAIAALVLLTLQAQAECNKGGNYVAKSGDVVATPRCKGFGDEGAHYRCRDGSFSHAEHSQGACSRHGGIAEAL